MKLIEKTNADRKWSIDYGAFKITKKLVMLTKIDQDASKGAKYD